MVSIDEVEDFTAFAVLAMPALVVVVALVEADGSALAPAPAPAPASAPASAPAPAPAPAPTSAAEFEHLDECNEWDLEQKRRRILAHLQSGQIVLAIKECEEALADLDNASKFLSPVKGSSGTSSSSSHISNDNRLPLLTLLSTGYGSTENWRGVVEASTQIIAINPSNFRALIKRADALERLGELGDARRDIRAALIIDGSNTEAMGLLDCIENKLGVTTANSNSINQAAAESTSIKSTETLLAPSSPVKPKAQLTTPVSSPMKSPSSSSKSPRSPASIPDVTVSTEDAAKSNELKEEGNNAIKINQFARAVDCYTKSIALDPTNLASYSNRAHANLKLSQYADADRDATIVINKAKQLLSQQDVIEDVKDATNKIYMKALFRRGTARKSIGGRNLAGALEDFDALLELDLTPANKKERETIAALLAERDASIAKTAVSPTKAPATATTSKKPAASTSVPPPATTSGLGISEVKTTLKKRVIDDDGSLAPNIPPSAPLAPAIESAASSTIAGLASLPAVPATPPTTPGHASSATRQPSSAAKKSAEKRGSGLLRAPEVPSEPPKTLYELERIWRGLKERPDLFAQYLGTFKKSTFKRVIKESLSPDLMSSLLVSLRDHATVPVITTVLEGFSETSGFEMTVQLLPEDDLACLQSIFAKICIADTDKSTANVVELKRKYGMR